MPIFNFRKRAKEDYDKAIELDPDDTRAYYNRGNSHSNLGQYQRAIEDHNETIQLNPNRVGGKVAGV